MNEEQVALLAEAGLKPEDFHRLISVEKVAGTGRIIVRAGHSLETQPIFKDGRPENFVAAAYIDGNVQYIFNPAAGPA